MEVSVKRYADVLVIAVEGRVDYVNAEDFKTAVLPHLGNCGNGADQVVFDLSQLEYISSAGLRVLMIAAKDVRARKGKLVSVSLQPVVREIFEISRFTLVFEIFDSAPEALRAISTAALAASQSG